MDDHDQLLLPVHAAPLITDPRNPQPQPPATGAPRARPYEQVLADAVHVMTEAVRLTSSRSDGAGTTATAGSDWAEFVVLALAGAAANAGGIENALAGRPGSWEADQVRNLLISTVGHDEQQLLEHRTEPVIVDVHVDKIMVDLGVWKAYNEAQQELTQRYSDASGATAGEQSRTLPPRVLAQEQRLHQLADLEQQLEAQRLREWAAYGQALKIHIEAAATRQQGLRVPVVVNVDVETFRSDCDDRSFELADQLLQEAITATPPPRNPLPL